MLRGKLNEKLPASVTSVVSLGKSTSYPTYPLVTVHHQLGGSNITESESVISQQNGFQFIQV